MAYVCRHLVLGCTRGWTKMLHVWRGSKHLWISWNVNPKLADPAGSVQKGGWCLKWLSTIAKLLLFMENRSVSILPNLNNQTRSANDALLCFSFLRLFSQMVFLPPDGLSGTTVSNKDASFVKQITKWRICLTMLAFTLRFRTMSCSPNIWTSEKSAVWWSMATLKHFSKIYPRPTHDLRNRSLHEMYFPCLIKTCCWRKLLVQYFRHHVYLYALKKIKIFIQNLRSLFFVRPWISRRKATNENLTTI